MKRKMLIILIVILAVALLGLSWVLGVNAYVKHSGGKSMVSEDGAAQLSDVDCIIILGCKVNGDTPSDMLEDRLLCGINLYKSGAAPKIIMSGDHGTVSYDEVNTMKQYAIDAGVPSSDVFMDHAGFSTYESVYRARDVFKAKKIIIVTQTYHLYRALYIANELGLEAYGVASDYDVYINQTQRELREVLARNKDFFTALFKPKPTYLGDAIPVSGNGDVTNDK
ncbi:MAG: SanA protein [Ruminococcaceae bacterium]|nr:SanA protein [Oscillospiraceae bacterium]